jgi:hypothetical protein
LNIHHKHSLLIKSTLTRFYRGRTGQQKSDNFGEGGGYPHLNVRTVITNFCRIFNAFFETFSGSIDSEEHFKKSDLSKFYDIASTNE